MIKRIVSFALHQPLFLLLIAALFVGIGVYAIKTLPIEAFPDVGDTQVNVIALYPGQAAEEVEKQVTIPLEVALSGLPHSIRMFSHTQFGLSFIMLTFDDKVTDYFARQQTMERLQGADLPPGVQPELGPLSSPTGEIYRYRLKGEGSSAEDLRTINDWTVVRQLKMVPGVADVTAFGGPIKQYEVRPNLEKMKYYNVTLQQLSTALARGNSNVGGSYVDRGDQQYLLRGIGLLRSREEIEGIVLTARNGTPVSVRNVAEVAVGSVPRQGIVGEENDDDIVTGIVLMRKGENPSEVLTNLKNRVGELNATVLPKGVHISPYYDRTWLIGTTLWTVFENLLTGALLVVIVLYVFLGNVRAAGIVAFIIPLALLATFIGLKLRGISANLLSLGAMDFGIIVDGAVIVVENIFRHLSERDHSTDRHTVRSAILEAAVEVGRPTFFSMLIIIVANIPIFALQRHEGRIFTPMAYTITSALIGSLVFSLTLVPLMCFYLLRGNLPHHDSRVTRWAKFLYEPLLRRAVVRPKIVLLAASLALVASLAVVPRLGTEFLPELNEGTIWVNINQLPGTSVSETVTLCRQIREAIRKIPEADVIVSKAGRPEDGTDPKPISMTETFVSLKPQSSWRKGMSKEKIVAEMRKALEVLPGVDPAFSQPIRDNVLESISQIDGQVVIKIFGPDLAVLSEKAQAILHAVQDVPGVSDSMIDRVGDVPQALIEIDRARAARYGLNVADVEDVIETGLAGKAATEIWEGEKHFSVVVRLPEGDRQLSNLRSILVDTPEGLHIPLDNLVTFKVASGAMNISRENGVRLKAVSIFIHGRDMGSVVADMQRRAKFIAIPEGYSVSWSGEFENQQRAMARLAIVVPLSVLLTFVLLFNTFGSVKHALLILLNVPFAVIGGIVALLATGIPLSVSAAIGFIALFGQAVLNGVVMISCFNQLRTPGQSPRDAVLKGSLMRLRTILMTALLAMLGLLPMALSKGIGSETQKPLAVVIIGGLVSATILTVIVLPTLYLWLETRPHPDDTPLEIQEADQTPLIEY